MKKVQDQGVHCMTDIEIIDETDSQLNQKLDYKDLLFQQITKIRLSGSVEFRGGYWEERTKVISGHAITEKFYVPDTRQIYIGSVDQLYDLLLPVFDESFKKKMSEEGDIKKELDNLKKLFKENKENKKESELNVFFYSELVRIQRRIYQELLLLIQRLGLFGVMKSKEVY